MDQSIEFIKLEYLNSLLYIHSFDGINDINQQCQ